jgi:hypothetical protein
MNVHFRERGIQVRGPYNVPPSHYSGETEDNSEILELAWLVGLRFDFDMSDNVRTAAPAGL